MFCLVLPRFWQLSAHSPKTQHCRSCMTITSVIISLQAQLRHVAALADCVDYWAKCQGGSPTEVSLSALEDEQPHTQTLSSHLKTLSRAGGNSVHSDMSIVGGLK